MVSFLFGEPVHTSDPQEKEILRGKSESTDLAIDTLIKQLFGLTEAKIQIVEGG